MLAKRPLAVLTPMGEGDMKPGLGDALSQGWRGKPKPVGWLVWEMMLVCVLCCSLPETTAGGSSTP